MRVCFTLLPLLVACASAPHPTPSPSTPAPAPTPHAGLQIKLVTVYVTDQDACLRFYTDVLGFQKKDDVTNGGFRWLSVTDGAADLQLAATSDPAGKAYQEALHAQHQPAVMFYTDDIRREVLRIERAGGTFTMPPTDVTMSTIAMLEDGCGNTVQLVQLKR